MRKHTVVSFVVAAVVLIFTGRLGFAAEIPVLEGLRPEINFWKAIFATYTTKQVVFHDPEDLSRVYSALDFADLESSGLSKVEIAQRRREAVDQEVERLRNLFLELYARAGNAAGMSKEEGRIARLFGSAPDPAVLLAAAADGRIRSQTGLRDRFERGLEISRRYLPLMERIFRAESLPISLTRLPFVESSFNVAAYSKVGAAGLWQFMPSTGRLYMTVDNFIDERRDPLASTIAAAKHLKRDYDALGSWPLAVTAYNHGRGGVARAAATVGSRDLVKIVREYRGPSFGFASRNFYAEFLAALEVERMASRHFGEIAAESELKLDIATVPVNATFSSLAAAAKVDRSTLAELNPALSSALISDQVAVPRGYGLRLPAGSREVFDSRCSAIEAVHARRTTTVARVDKSRRSAGATRDKAGRRRSSGATFVRHRVRPGQTLSMIAKQYQTTIGQIRRHNRLANPDHVPVGQTLVIPKG